MARRRELSTSISWEMIRRPLAPFPVDLEDSVDITSPSGRESGQTPCRRMASSVERFVARDRSPGGIATQLTRLGDQYKKTGCYGV